MNTHISLVLTFCAISNLQADVPFGELILFRSADLKQLIRTYGTFSSIPRQKCSEKELVSVEAGSLNSFSFSSQACSFYFKPTSPLARIQPIKQIYPEYKIQYTSNAKIKESITFVCKIIRTNLNLEPINKEDPIQENRVIHASKNWQEQEFVIILIYENFKR